MSEKFSLFQETSEGLEFLLNRYKIDWSLGEFCFIRKLALESLNCAEITEKTYNPGEHHFIKMEALYLHINEIYDTYHSFADIKKYKDN